MPGWNDEAGRQNISRKRYSFAQGIIESESKIEDENLKKINLRKVGIEQKIDGIDFVGNNAEILKRALQEYK